MLLQNVSPRNPEADQATNSAQTSSQFSEILLEKLSVWPGNIRQMMTNIMSVNYHSKDCRHIFDSHKLMSFGSTKLHDKN